MSKKVVDETEDIDMSDLLVQEESDESKVHSAIGILRKRISSQDDLKSEYFSWSELDLKFQKDFTDPLLYKAICWLTDKKAFEEAADLDDQPPRLAPLAIASDIIYASRSLITPKHLGLAVHLHHEYGSRKLTDDLHAHGYCISYD